MMQDWIHLLRSTIQQANSFSYPFLDNSGSDPSLRLYRFLTFTFEQCWLNSSGPVPDSLTGQCCKVATSDLSRRIEPSLSQGNYSEVLQITVDYLSGLSLRYKYILLPFLNIHLVFKIRGLSTAQNTKHLGNEVLPNVLAFLFRNRALCEAETLVHTWLSFAFADGDLDLASKRAIETKPLTRIVRVWFQKQVVDYFNQHSNVTIGWLHRDVLQLFDDNPFALDCRAHHLIDGTKTVLQGLFCLIHQTSHEHNLTRDIPHSFLYDQIAREITRRVQYIWLQSQTMTSNSAKHRHEQFLLQLTYCVSRCALCRHAPLIVVAIELSILTMVCLSTRHGTKSPMSLLRSSECHKCQMHDQGRVAHHELVKLISKLYQSQPDVTIQSVLDSPQSSPLSALSADGLDLGHTFMLVSKFMKWHGLALAEAQALSVCSEWMSSSSATCSRESFRRLSEMQADAESRALHSLIPNRSDYVYDDVVDAYVLRDSSIPNMCPSVSRSNNIPPTKRKRINFRDTLDIRSPTFPTTHEDNDEIDFLTNATVLDSARVSRRVQRLDIGAENRKQRRLSTESTRRKSLLPYL